MKKIISFTLLASTLLLQVGCALPKPQTSNLAPAVVNQSTELEIKVGSQTTRFTREQLLDSPSLKEISIEHDPAYPGLRMTYQAVPASILFKDVLVDNHSTMLFKCLDGFSAPISTARLLNTNKNKAVAYIAIETPSEPWPKLKSNAQKTAGPFYLVWLNPKKSKISTEEWPFQLAGFEQKPSIEVQFPHVIPGRTISEKNPIHKGFKLFMQNCFACHTINGEGQSQLGPDLNIPYNPTEYLKPTFFSKLVRNPQSLRSWPGSKMSAFNKEQLSDQDVMAIFKYLQHMSKRKVNSTSTN